MVGTAHPELRFPNSGSRTQVIVGGLFTGWAIARLLGGFNSVASARPAVAAQVFAAIADRYLARVVVQFKINLQVVDGVVFAQG